MLSDCGVIFTKQADTPNMRVGDVYELPDSPYSLKIVSQECHEPDIENSFSRMEIRKNGKVITTHDFFIGGDPALFDEGSLCVALYTTNCVAPYFSGYRVWYNPVEECWISDPAGGCTLSARTGKIIVGVTAGLLAVGITYKVVKRKEVL